MSRSPIRTAAPGQSTRAPASDLFRRAPIATAIATLTLLGSASVFAADAAAPAPAASASAAAPAASASAASNEAPALDAVVVHSRNRIERLQDVPVSVSVVTGAELDRMDAYSVGAIAKRAANVSWNLGNQRTSSISIRGIGKIGQTEAQDPSVGVIVDGVSYSYNALTSSFDFVDIDTVEVARGPQGTLQGKNASVGSISINTKRPSFTPSADYTLAFNQHNGILGVAAIGGTVVEDLVAWRGTFSVDRQPGDKTNAFNRDVTYTNTDRVSGRVQFLVTPTDNLSARFEADIQPRAGETTNGRTLYKPTPSTYADGNANGAVTNDSRLSRSWFTQNSNYTLANYYSGISSDSQRPLVTGSTGLTSDVNWKLPTGQTLTSITAYKTYHFNAVNDEGTPFDVARNSGGFWNDYKQVSQELRLSSAVGGFFDYQAGLFLMKVNNKATYQKFLGDDAGAWYASNSQYATLSVDAPGRLLMQDSLSNLSLDYNSPAGIQNIVNKSAAIFGQANWHFTDAFTLTTGLRLTHEDRNNTAWSGIVGNGNGAALNPTVVNGVNLGGFDSDATTGVLNNDNTADQLALANAVALKYFGVSSYSSLSSAQQKEVAAAKALRKAQIGVVYNPTKAQPYTGNLPSVTLSPSYKFSANQTGYFTYQHGEKAGISQVINGVSALVAPEKTNAFELGLKSALLDKTLILNVDIFDMVIHNYQQAISVPNPLTPTDPTTNVSATGSADKVQVKGLEFDGVYGGIPRTTLRFSGSYNDAKYVSFTNSPQPVENGDLASNATNPQPYHDVSGQTLAGAPKWTFNVGGDYHQPVFSDKDAHVSANFAYSSKFNSDVALSQYAWVGSQLLTDFAVGLGKRDKTFDVSVIVKNLFNNETPQARTWNSVSPAVGRNFGIQFTGKL